MPWHVAKSSECSPAKPWAVIKNAGGSVVGCHPSEAAAKKQLAALYASEPRSEPMTQEDRAGLPEPMRENLVRAMPGLELKGEPADGRLGTLFGRLANYEHWTEIRSAVEYPYHFLER